MNSKVLYFLSLLFLLASIGGLFFLLTRGVQRPQNPVPSRAAGNPLKCQGNTDAPAKCFDCWKETAGSVSEVNVVDYSCFAKLYGKDVGKP